MQELTTNGLITEIQTVTIDKLKAQTLLNELEIELNESELVTMINKQKTLIKELNTQETEIKNKGIEILQKAGIDKFESNGIEVRIKTSPGKLVITEESLIPTEYIKEVVKTTKSVDKKLIKENMKEGEIIDGCHLEQDVTLEIKHK